MIAESGASRKFSEPQILLDRNTQYGMEFIPPACAAQSVGPANTLLSTLFTALIAAHCNMSSTNMWPEDHGPTALRDGLDDYDFVVVGGGTAGSIVANRLSENPRHKVLVIEAGGNPPIESQVPELLLSAINSRYSWGYTTLSNGHSCMGYINESCSYPKGRMLGGDSGLTAMVYLRGTHRDYNDWERAGNPTWGWSDVLPYFMKSEDFRGTTSRLEHGIGGLLPIDSINAPRTYQNTILRIARELGYPIVDDFVEENYLGYGYLYTVAANGRRINPASPFLNVDRHNLHVMKHSEATRIRFNREYIANGVSFVYDGHNKMRVRAKKEVILSAGTIGSPKLLMLSGLGPDRHLRHLEIPTISDLRVGDNLQDHTRLDIYFMFKGAGSQPSELDILDRIYRQWIHQEGPLTVFDLLGSTHTKRQSHQPDVHYYFRQIFNVSSPGFPLKPEILDSLVSQAGPNDLVFVAHVAATKPKSKGYVRLRSADYRDHPYIYPNYFHREEDMRVTVRAIKELFDFERTAEFRRNRGRFLRLRLPECDHEMYKSSEYWSCYVKYMSDSIFNIVGTVKMGPKDDLDAVVDHKLRVRGVKGLRVIDASIMPTIPTAITSATTFMIAEKGADFVKDAWRR